MLVRNMSPYASYECEGTMPLDSWPRPCPIELAVGKLNFGRVYMKKTCGGSDCVKIWRSWNSATQAKWTSRANMTIAERMEDEHIEQQLNEEARLQRLKLPPEQQPEDLRTKQQIENDNAKAHLDAMFGPRGSLRKKGD